MKTTLVETDVTVIEQELNKLHLGGGSPCKGMQFQWPLVTSSTHTHNRKATTQHKHTYTDTKTDTHTHTDTKTDR